jgi:general L-amino acid transport system permease protein
MALLFVVGIVVSWWWAKRARVHQAATGQMRPVLLPSIGLIVGLPLIAWLIAGAPLEMDVPALRGFNFQGGSVISPEFTALLFGLVVYTASYIAEIVRAGIDAVPRGQVEAARSLGLRSSAINAKIVVPQALRVIVPPLGNEYLRLFRNTTLAAAIGYPDLTLIFAGTAVNQTAQPVEVMLIVCVSYLAINLAVSAGINAYNRRIARSYR